MSTQPINIRPTVSPTNVNVPSALLINAAAPVVDKLVNMAGNAAFNFLGGAYDSAYQHTLGKLTDEKTAKNIDDLIRPGTGEYTDKAVTGNIKSGIAQGRLTPVRATPQENVTERTTPQGATEQVARFLKDISALPKEEGWKTPFLQNPEMVAQAAGIALPTAAIAIPLAGAAIGLNLAGGMGKPKTAVHTLPVEGSATNNPSIDSAIVSGEIKREQSDREFARKIYLEKLRQGREQAWKPGPQAGIGYADPAGYGGAPPINEEVLSVGRSIYGTGVRL